MLKTACGLQVPSILKQYSRENTAFFAGIILGFYSHGLSPRSFEPQTAHVCLVESTELEFGMKTPVLCSGSALYWFGDCLWQAPKALSAHIHRR